MISLLSCSVPIRSQEKTGRILSMTGSTGVGSRGQYLNGSGFVPSVVTREKKERISCRLGLDSG